MPTTTAYRRQNTAPKSVYHFAESYLSREQIERVLNHYRDYISAALYILHDKDRKHVENDAGVRRTELQQQYNKFVKEINILELSITKATEVLNTRNFANDEEKALYRKMEISEKKRQKTNLQKKAMRINDDIREINKQYEDAGTIKQPHFHILIKCYSSHTAESVRNWFYRFRVTEEKKNDETGEKEILLVNTLNKIADSVGSCRDYLTHKNEPEDSGQYYYDTKDVLTFGAGWQAFNKAGRAADDILDILDRIMDGDSLRDLVRDYGRDLVLNYHRYVGFAARMYAQESSAQTNIDREDDIIRTAKKDPDTDWYQVLNELNQCKYVVEKAAQIIQEVNFNR